MRVVSLNERSDFAAEELCLLSKHTTVTSNGGMVVLSITLKIKDTQCVGGTGNPGGGGTGGSGGGTPPATPLAANTFCKIQAEEPANARPKPTTEGNTPRVKLPKGTEVFVRGFVQDEAPGVARRWVSIDVTIDGKAFGAGSNHPAPTFGAESQLRLNGAADGGVSCRPRN